MLGFKHIIKYPLLLSGFFFFFIIPSSAPATEKITARSVFESLQKFRRDTLPPEFKADIKSPLFSNQFKNIPEDKITYNKKPVLKAAFKQNHNPSLILEGVSDFYKFYFSFFEQILLKSGIFTGVAENHNYRDFIKNYMMYWYKGTARYPNILKMIEADALEGDYGRYYLSDKWQIHKGEFFTDKKKVLSFEITYFRTNHYILPEVINVKIFQNEILKADFPVAFEKYEIP